MKSLDRRFLSIFSVFVFTALAHDAAAGTGVECIKSVCFLAPIEDRDERNYPPDREAIVSHLTLDLAPDFKQRPFEGKAIFQFKPNREQRKELEDLKKQFAAREATAAKSGSRKKSDKKAGSSL